MVPKEEGKQVEAPSAVVSLWEAAKGGDLDGVKKWREAGADVNHPHGDTSAIHGAAAGGHVEVVSYLLQVGANPEAPVDPWYEGDYAGGTGALHCAAQNNHPKVLELLLSRGADINKKSWWPHLLTPLHTAASADNLEAVKALLEAQPALDQEAGPGCKATQLYTLL